MENFYDLVIWEREKVSCATMNYEGFSPLDCEICEYGLTSGRHSFMSLKLWTTAILVEMFPIF